jgi:hypothetical protein
VLDSTVRIIIEHAGEIKEKDKVTSDFCGLQTLVTVWIEDCSQKRIALSRAVIQTEALNLFKRVKEKIMKQK